MNQKNIILGFGAPFTGKTLHLGSLAQELKCRFFDMGSILRVSAGIDKPIGWSVKGYLERGSLVPDDLTLKILFRALHRARTDSIFLAGCPRTKNQARKILQYFGTVFPKHQVSAIYFSVPEKEIWNRWQSHRAGKMKSSHRDGRTDDHDYEKFSKRLGIFKKDTHPAFEFIAKKVVHTIKIDGDHEITQVFNELRKRVCSILSNLTSVLDKPNVPAQAPHFIVSSGSRQLTSN